MRSKNHSPQRPATISPEKVSPKKRWLQDMSKFDQNENVDQSENDLAEIINVHEEQSHRNIEMESSKKPPRKKSPVTTSVRKKSKSQNIEDMIIEAQTADSYVFSIIDIQYAFLSTKYKLGDKEPTTFYADCGNSVSSWGGEFFRERQAKVRGTNFLGGASLTIRLFV